MRPGARDAKGGHGNCSACLLSRWPPVPICPVAIIRSDGEPAQGRWIAVVVDQEAGRDGALHG